MTNMVRCGTCKGLKELPGMGGMVRECRTCKGEGKVEKLEVKVKDPVDAVTPDMFSQVAAADYAYEAQKAMREHYDKENKTNPHYEKASEALITGVSTVIDVHETEVCSLEDIFPGVSAMAAAATDEIVRAISMQDVPRAKEPIFLGYEDEFMRGILAESSMDTEAFKKAYPSIVETTDVRQRNEIRVMYAQSKPMKPRKVNLAAQQEATIQNDAEFKAFDAQYKKAQEKAKAKK